ncbi:hypothetical protein GWI33_010777 [Rhynchophorus ferrugineus]|uniref:Uncharacterized protein n=1 Tax=Rhynchophorus ferrugineus TaxID=354439 RepID=A0A834IUM8_RHYFE|nr:hypothetical protein GWI33_010777 [Rhynchophorus ferrugineus]
MTSHADVFPADIRNYRFPAIARQSFRSVSQFRSSFPHNFHTPSAPQIWQYIIKDALKRVESYIVNRGHHLADIIFQS